MKQGQESISASEQFALLMVGAAVVSAGGLAWLGDRVRAWALEHHILVRHQVVLHIFGDAGLDWRRLTLLAGIVLLGLVLVIRGVMVRRVRAAGLAG